MTQATLRTVTLETVANYRQVAEHAIHAYRAGGHRLLAAMGRGVDRAASRGVERLAPRLADAFRRTSDKVTVVAAKGIDTVSVQTGRVLEFGSAGVVARVGRVADLVEGIESRYIVSGLQAAARFSLTGAQAARALSEKLMVGADKLSGAIGGSVATRANATAGSAKRRATAQGRAAAKSARRVGAPAKVKTTAKTRTQAARARRAG